MEQIQDEVEREIFIKKKDKYIADDDYEDEK
jgi:hypothetical protein